MSQFERVVIIRETVDAWEVCKCFCHDVYPDNDPPSVVGDCPHCQGSGGKWHKDVTFGRCNDAENSVLPSVYQKLHGILVDKQSKLVREWVCPDEEWEIAKNGGWLNPCSNCTAGPWRVKGGE